MNVTLELDPHSSDTLVVRENKTEKTRLWVGAYSGEFMLKGKDPRSEAVFDLIKETGEFKKLAEDLGTKWQKADDAYKENYPRSGIASMPNSSELMREFFDKPVSVDVDKEAFEAALKQSPELGKG